MIVTTDINPQYRIRVFYISLLGFSLSILASFWIDSSFIAQASSVVGTATVIQFLVAGLFMLLAWKTYPRTESAEFKTNSQPNPFLFILLLGIFLRILLIPIDSYTSNDTTRYLFDGKLAYEGIDPYQTAHDAAELQVLKQQWAPPEEHAKYVTLYPPLALALFALSASDGIEYAPLTWKLIVTFFSILTLLLAASLLRALKRKHYLPLIALSPLLILEAGVGAHLDTLSAFSVTLIAYCLWMKKPSLLGFSIAIGTAIKLLPLALLMPIFLLAFFKRKFAFAFITVFSTLFGLILIYGSTFALGFKPIGSIGIFFQKWRFGSPVFNFLENNLSNPALLIVLAILFISGLVAISTYLYCSKAESHNEQYDKLLSAMQYVMTLPLILSPVIFSWYLMPLAVLAALQPKPWLLAWILLAPLSYEVLNQFLCCSVWQPALWPLVTLATAIIFALLSPIFSKHIMPTNIKRSF
jgi:alpha-1,6-mannosyltransferase